MCASSTPIDCEQALASIRGVVGGQLSNADRMALRHHVLSCEDCHEEFVASVETLAALGHERRLNRVVEEKARRRFELRHSIEQVEAPRKFVNARLRTMVYPAFFAFLMLALAGRLPFGGGPTVLAQGPGVWVRGHELTVDAGEASLKRGEVLHTTPGGHALIHVRGTVWRMRDQGALRLESVVNPAMRLAEGDLVFRGQGRCLTEYGIVQGEEDSLVHLNVDDSGMTLRVEEGTATFVTSSGETRLVVGPRWRVDGNGKLTELPARL